MKSNKGFTLIELLVVIAIIGVLSSIVLVSMGGARVDARNTARQSDMRQLITAQEMYYGTNETYFTAVSPGVDQTVPNGGTPEITGYLDVLHDGKSGYTDYTWVANAGVPACASETAGEFFCVYVPVEGETNAWYAASEKGTKKLQELEINQRIQQLFVNVGKKNLV